MSYTINNIAHGKKESKRLFVEHTGNLKRPLTVSKAVFQAQGDVAGDGKEPENT